MAENNESALKLLGERIKQRSVNVALTAEQRRTERAVNSSSKENVDFFLDNFQSMKENLESKLNSIDSITKDDLIEYLDGLVADVSDMQKFLNESSMFLPSFQIKKAQETINSLNESIQTAIVKMQPKKKFGFKNKKTSQTDRILNKKEESTTDGALANYLKDNFFFGFKDVNNELLVMESHELKNRQLNLQNLVNCKVIALGNPSSLQFTSLKDCTVIIGPTSRSAFIKNCKNCNFVLACQQVRIHCCEFTNFYLHVTGAAIIEECKNVCFGPYTLEYNNKYEDFKDSGLSVETNNWNKIEDFNWLNENELSPNFQLIEELNWKNNWM